MNKTVVAALAFLVTLSVVSCGDDKPLIPKPPTYLRNEFPPHTYKRINIDNAYGFDLSEAYTYSRVQNEGQLTRHLDIDLGKLNGVIHFSYIEMEEPLKTYIDYSLKKIEEHEVKADAIDDEQFLHPEKRVFGTFFELKGDVASPFQFYLTDSTGRFVSGAVYFNARPNYDSLRPSLDYLKTDLKRLIESFSWGK